MPYAALALAGALTASPAQAQNVQAGTLVCDVSGGIGMIIASQRDMACNFTNSRGEAEVYIGRIRRFGLDIGTTAGGQIVWAVFAPSGRYARGALAGTYGGASAEATVVAGLGANVLLGGSNRSVALQPVSLQGQAGLNVAAGVADLQLVPAQPMRRR
jgi:hypothetical protein